MITYDEHENAFFEVGDINYKMPRLKWMQEEQFLIVMRKAGIVSIGESENKDIDIISEEGIKVRELVIGWLFYSKDGGSNYLPLNNNAQVTHFKSVLEVYEVLPLAIEAISHFLSQATQSRQSSSHPQYQKKSKKANTAGKPLPTLNR